MTAYLLDTNILIWSALEPNRLSRKVSKIITDKNNFLFLSSASVWEIAIKHEKGLLELKTDCVDFIQSCIEHLRLSVLSIQWIDCLKAASLPKNHLDPFDRIIVWQAQERNIPVVTSDKLFKNYSIKIILNG